MSERLRAVRPGGSRRLRPWHGLAALTLGAGVLLAGFLLATLESANHFAVELTSTPPGASVRVDGRDWPAPTPALITRLEADREHLIEVRLGGMQPWSQRVHAEHGDTLAVHAPLPPERRPASTPPVARLPALPQEGRYPLSGFIVSTGHHALRVPPSPAARLGLDPRKSYVVSTASQPRPAFDVIYLLTGGARLAARESFGLVGPSPTTVRHASSLYLFVLGAPSAAGHLEVHVREELSGAVTTVSVEASHNTVALPPQARFTLRGLDPAATYELLLREMDPPAHTRGRQGAPVGQVLSLQGGAQGETQGSARVLEVGHPYRVTGAAWVLFTFPDDELGDNLGALSVDVTPVPLPRSPAASRPPGRG